MFATKKSLYKKIIAELEPELQEWEKLSKGTTYDWAYKGMADYMREYIKKPVKGKEEYKFILSMGIVTWAVTYSLNHIWLMISQRMIPISFFDAYDNVFGWFTRRAVYLGFMTEPEADELTEQVFDKILEIKYPKDDDD